MDIRHAFLYGTRDVTRSIISELRRSRDNRTSEKLSFSRLHYNVNIVPIEQIRKPFPCEQEAKKNNF